MTAAALSRERAEPECAMRTVCACSISIQFFHILLLYILCVVCGLCNLLGTQLYHASGADTFSIDLVVSSTPHARHGIGNSFASHARLMRGRVKDALTHRHAIIACKPGPCSSMEMWHSQEKE
jgi:hypothetical protein